MSALTWDGTTEFATQFESERVRYLRKNVVKIEWQCLRQSLYEGHVKTAQLARLLAALQLNFF